jgi:hypothetical protein
MEIVDVGNINEDTFCIEFDQRPSLEDAAEVLADEYRKCMGSDVSCRGPLQGDGKVYYLLERQHCRPELELTETEGDISHAFDVKKALILDFSTYCMAI